VRSFPHIPDLVGSHSDRSGAFSNVYKAIDLTTGKKVAGMFASLRIIHWLTLLFSESSPKV
jgi:hypothetical protein